jgi:cellulose synthase (UDP-forming)
MRIAAHQMKNESPQFVPLEWPRRLLVAGFLAVSIWYLAWRIGTFNPNALWFSALVYGAEVFGLGTALLHIFMCWRLTERHAPPPRLGIGVDVFVPTYNESVDLVRKTLLAARGMDYPHKTWLLDDGRRPEMQALARQLGCEYLARPDNANAKAGNLNHALALSDGELVAVFDADHAPRRDFLTRTLGYFDDARVAFVQTPQDFYNLDSYQHRRRGAGRTVWTEQALFFRIIQRGKDYWNAAFFCGSCAVVRRSALEEIGGFATGTVTEDLHTSLRLHARGHRSIYHAEPLAFGLAPESIEPFIGQRVRWGQGAMHVWRKEGILSHRGLSLAQRFNYLASALTYFDGWQKAIFYFAPAVVLLTGVLPLLTTTPEFLLHFLPYYALTFWVFEEVGRGYGRSLIIEQYNMARFAAFAWATLAWFFPRMKFRVTAKGGSPGHRATRFTAPQWTVLALNGIALPVGTVLYLWTHALPLDGLIANALWAMVNVTLALAVISFTTMTQRNARARYRFPISLAAEIVVADGTRLRGTVDDLSESGMRFYGKMPVSLAVGDALTGHFILPEGKVPFWGRVQGRIPAPGDGQVGRAIGCEFATSDEGRTRIEGFLFGSDLQWVLNGYSDRVHTPMSRWMPRLVAGPVHNPFADVRWNAAELRIERDGPAEPVLLSTTQGGSTEIFIVSHNALPEGRDLFLDVHVRTDTPRRCVQLERFRLPGVGEDDASLCTYRIDASVIEPAPTISRPTVAAYRNRSIPRQRDLDALPSTY